jgi:hypothetical protein
MKVPILWGLKKCHNLAKIYYSEAGGLFKFNNELGSLKNGLLLLINFCIPSLNYNQKRGEAPKANRSSHVHSLRSQRISLMNPKPKSQKLASLG